MELRNVLELVIDPTLKALDLHSDKAVLLLIGTGLAESGFRAIRQSGQGPAFGLWQMEGATHDDIWENYLKHRPELAQKVIEASHLFQETPSTDKLAWNLRYGAAMCRVHYVRKPSAIPDTLDRQAAYWKQHYNTPAGAGTVRHYKDAWHNAGLGDF